MAEFKATPKDQATNVASSIPLWKKLFNQGPHAWVYDLSTGKRYQVGRLQVVDSNGSLPPLEAVTPEGEAVFLRFLRPTSGGEVA